VGSPFAGAATGKEGGEVILLLPVKVQNWVVGDAGVGSWLIMNLGGWAQYSHDWVVGVSSSSSLGSV